MNRPEPASKQLVVDSGASMSIMTDRRAFVYINPDDKVQVRMGAKAKVMSQGTGKIRVLMADEVGNTIMFERQGVIYCPDFEVDILSVRQEITDEKSNFRFHTNRKGTEGSHRRKTQRRRIHPEV